MNSLNPWHRLGEAARRRPRTETSREEMPFGFDTRVLARLRAVRELPAETWFRLALRAIPVGAVIALACWFSLRPEPVRLSTDEARLAEAASLEMLQP
jgi:hypothetical protein